MGGDEAGSTCDGQRSSKTLGRRFYLPVRRTFPGLDCSLTAGILATSLDSPGCLVKGR